MTETAQTSLIDAWIAQASVPELEDELAREQEAFDQEMERFRRWSEALRAKHDDLERRRRVMKMLHELVPSGESSRPQLEFSAVEPETKPEIARRALEVAGEGTFPRDARSIAIKRGWLPPDPAAGNQLSVAMNKMARQGRLLKDDDGRYYLPEWDDTPSGEDETTET